MSRRTPFAVLLRHHRSAANLTQEELAARSGLSVQAISALERGGRLRPRPSTVEFLARALRLDDQLREALVSAARADPAPRDDRRGDADPAGSGDRGADPEPGPVGPPNQLPLD